MGILGEAKRRGRNALPVRWEGFGGSCKLICIVPKRGFHPSVSLVVFTRLLSDCGRAKIPPPPNKARRSSERKVVLPSYGHLTLMIHATVSTGAPR